MMLNLAYFLGFLTEEEAVAKSAEFSQVDFPPSLFVSWTTPP